MDKTNGLTVLTRIAQRNPAKLNKLEYALSSRLNELSKEMIDVAQGSPASDFLDDLLTELLANHSDKKLLQSLVEHIVYPTVNLRELGVLCSHVALEAAETLPENETNLETQAALANNLAIRLSDVGKTKTALERAEQALNCDRLLATKYSHIRTTGLGMSLNNVANRLQELGKLEEAVKFAREATSYYQNKTDKTDKTTNAEEARALNTLSLILREQGESDEALEHMQDAAQLYRNLVEEHPVDFYTDLAAVLGNLAATLSDMGNSKQALSVAKEALKVRRELANARPDTFLPELAASLNNVSMLLSEIGEPREGLTYAEKAVQIRRDLTKARYEIFSAELALSLGNLATLYSELPKHDKAQECIEEALALHEKFRFPLPEQVLVFITASDVYSSLGNGELALDSANRALSLAHQFATNNTPKAKALLAKALSSLVVVLLEAKQYKTAWDYAQESVTLRRELVKINPEAFTADLARSLHNLVIISSMLGQYKDALIYARETLEHRQSLAKLHKGFNLELISMLINHSNTLLDLGYSSEALESAQEALVLCKEYTLEKNNSDLLALVHNSLANCFREVGEKQIALKHAKKAINLRCKLVTEQPQVIPDLAMLLSNTAILCNENQESEKAILYSQKAISYYRDLVKFDPKLFQEELARALNSSVNLYRQKGEFKEAQARAKEAVDIYRGLAKNPVDVVNTDFALALHNLATVLSDLDHCESSLVYYEEAIAHLKPFFLNYPDAFARKMLTMLSNYTTYAEGCGETPNQQLVQDIYTKFKELASE